MEVTRGSRGVHLGSPGVTWGSLGVLWGSLGGHLGSLGVTWGSRSTSKMMLMCISGGLEGLKIENVEKVFVFKRFLDVRVPLSNRLSH